MQQKLEKLLLIGATDQTTKVLKTNVMQRVVYAGSWQEMAAVLDMLQDISIPCENSQLATSRSHATSPTHGKPRCASAQNPASPSRAGKQHRCTSALSPTSHRLTSKSLQEQQSLSDFVSSSGAPLLRSPLNDKLKGSRLSARKLRHDWQS